MGGAHGRARALVALLLVLLPVLGLLPPQATADRAGGRGRASAADELVDRFLTTRPPVGPTWVVDLGAEPAGRAILARTLQGVVNRTAARLYLLTPGDPTDQTWLDDYQSRGLVTVAGATDLDGALDLFAAEATGYVLADEAEPWTIDVAATIAAAEGALVATPGEVVGLEARGLSLVEDVRGRWSDAATAYEDTVAAYRDLMPSPNIAILRPTDNLFDFTTQQGILTLFTRPSDADWPRMRDLVTGTPAGSIVYGYVSDTGDEEAVAVAALSDAGLLLVPTDTTRNLSYHVAVGASRPRARIVAADVGDVAPCTSDTVNVVVGLTDGDNLNVPISHFPRPADWGSPRRGELPLGWSLGPDLALLAPSIWDSYVTTATAADELVGMIGYAYAAPAVLPDPAEFYASSFALMDELGMTTFWSLGGGLETPSAPGWSILDEAAGDGIPDGVLVGYGNAVGGAFHSPAGRPAFTSPTLYGETPDQMRQHVLDLLAADPADRPPVTFLAATNWTNPAHDLIGALQPLEDLGVRFLTPAEAAACFPAGDLTPPPVPDGACFPDEATLRPHGLALVSAPVAAEVVATPTVLDVVPAVTAPAAADAGAEVRAEAVVPIDLQTFVDEVLEERVKPTVEAGYGPLLAATAWATIDVGRLELRLRIPGAEPVGAVEVTAAGTPGATAAWEGDTVVVDLDPVSVDSRTSTPASELRVSWISRAPTATAGSELIVVDGGMEVDLDLTVGVVLGDLDLAGGVAGTWRCATRPGVLASTFVAGTGASPSSTAPPDGAGSTTAPPPAVTAIAVTPVATPVTARPAYTG